MKKITTWIYIISKSILKNPLLIILIVCIPLFAVIIGMYGSEDSDSGYKAGIYLEKDNNDETALMLADNLLNSDGAVGFKSYDSLDDMYRDVMSEKIVCGYIFPDTLSYMGVDEDCDDTFYIIKQSGSSIQAAINELIYSRLIRIQGYDIITDYMISENIFKETDTESIKELTELYEEFLDGSETFNVIFETYGVTGLEETDGSATTIAFPVRGILSILIFLAGLLGGVMYLHNREKGVFEALSSNYRIFCHVLYIAIPIVLFALSVLLTLGVSGNFTTPVIELPAMLLYIIIAALFCYAFTLLIKKSSTLTACIPVLMLGCLIFCPVFINASSYFPAASVIEKLFMPYYYLNLFM